MQNSKLWRMLSPLEASCNNTFQVCTCLLSTCHTQASMTCCHRPLRTQIMQKSCHPTNTASVPLSRLVQNILAVTLPCVVCRAGTEQVVYSEDGEHLWIHPADGIRRACSCTPLLPHQCGCNCSFVQTWSESPQEQTHLVQPGTSLSWALSIA